MSRGRKSVRRSVIAAGVVVAVSALVTAGCSSASDSSGEPSASSTFDTGTPVPVAPTPTATRASVTPTTKPKPSKTADTPVPSPTPVRTQPADKPKVAAQRAMACSPSLPGGVVITDGVTGSNVRALQWGLNQLGYQAFTGGPLTVDGSYNLMVKEAVGQFQTDTGLSASKKVDQQTWQKMSEQLHTNGPNRC